mmetsp:Transcript_7096/g.15137  ORF Transcript_7096/g.15137 Transcript_7096/m.15137 type:complete len:255 (+) Transcript_7096:768-1532(+)
MHSCLFYAIILVAAIVVAIAIAVVIVIVGVALSHDVRILSKRQGFHFDPPRTRLGIRSRTVVACTGGILLVKVNSSIVVVIVAAIGIGIVVRSGFDFVLQQLLPARKVVCTQNDTQLGSRYVDNVLAQGHPQLEIARLVQLAWIDDDAIIAVLETEFDADIAIATIERNQFDRFYRVKGNHWIRELFLVSGGVAVDGRIDVDVDIVLGLDVSHPLLATAFRTVSSRLLLHYKGSTRRRCFCLCAGDRRGLEQRR